MRNTSGLRDRTAAQNAVVTQFIVRRLALALPILLGVTILNFILLNAAPGDPVDALVDPFVGAAEREIRRAQLGLDQPIHVRYVAWLGEAVHGNLGYSYTDYRPVTQKIGERLGPTMVLVLTAYVLAYVFGIVLGVIGALRPYSRTDFIVTFIGIMGVAMPGFYVGLIALYVFALRVPLFPTGGMLTTGASFTVPDLLVHMALPVTALALFDLASITRYTRASMLEVLDLDYVRTAHAKGLRPRQVVLGHALRNALNPLITQAGLALPRIVGGAVVIETVFGWPGMGRLVVEAIGQRDYPVMMGVTFVIAAMVILGSLVADLLYGVADPRIRRG